MVYPNTNLDSILSTLKKQEDFKKLINFLTLSDGSGIDFLGCDSYLESLVPKMSLLHLKSLYVSLFGWDTASCLSSL